MTNDKIEKLHQYLSTVDNSILAKGFIPHLMRECILCMIEYFEDTDITLFHVPRYNLAKMYDEIREDDNDIEYAKLLDCFPESYINKNEEFIADRDSNTYFDLSDCENEIGLKCKILEWLSYAAYNFDDDIENDDFHEFISNGANEYLGTNFGEEEWELIYRKLGYGINRKLCERFIESGYDLELLK